MALPLISIPSTTFIIVSGTRKRFVPYYIGLIKSFHNNFYTIKYSFTAINQQPVVGSINKRGRLIMINKFHLHCPFNMKVGD